LLKHEHDEPKASGVKTDYEPSSAKIDSAITLKKAVRSLWRHGDPTRLDGEYRKSLTQFAYRAKEWLVPAEMSSRVIRCIIEADDLSSFVSHERISGPAITFPIDEPDCGRRHNRPPPPAATRAGRARIRQRSHARS
jgi:hypothetical protein